jgi:hypothetical protein
MKTIKVSTTLALAVLSGGLLAASAAKVPPATESYGVSISFDTAPTIHYVYGVPVPTNQVAFTTWESVNTDGSGKISGVTGLTIPFLDDSNNIMGYADLVVNVTGTIKGTPPDATVKMNLKGNGVSFSSDNTTTGAASISLNFTGTPQANHSILGTFSGTVKTGLPDVNSGKPIKVKNDAAIIRTGDVNWSDVDVVGGVTLVGSKLYSAGWLADENVPYSGSGSVNKGKFKATLKGVAWGKGSQESLSGTTAVVTNGFVTIGTNQFPIQITIPANITAKGKIAGQSFTASGSTVDYFDFED